jgi:carboxymethylenebutenolidase
MINLKYNNKDFPAYIAKPSQDIRGGLILIHEVWGLTDHIKDIADRFSKEGYLVIAPNLISETDIEGKVGSLNIDLFNPEKRSEAQPKLRVLMTPIKTPEFSKEAIGKLEVCFNYLYNLPETKQNVAVIGFCFGGTYSFSFAENEPRLKAAIPFYGHASNNLEDIAKIKCPLLAFYGEKDSDLMESLPMLIENMNKANIDFTYKVYPNVGHAFFNDTNPFSYNKEVAQDAWSRTLDFLDKNI